MNYKENPKTKGSGIVCCIPQATTCPLHCPHCFFSGGRSYLEPMAENLPNIPDPEYVNSNGLVVRMNDGNDSNIERDKVIACAKQYKEVFFNTSLITNIRDFPGPVVLTVNPKDDLHYHKLMPPMPKNLMFVRVRVNTWNKGLVDMVIDHYALQHKVPVILTFMAYPTVDAIPESEQHRYVYRKRTLNEYWAISREAWLRIMQKYEDLLLVYSCGNEDLSGNNCSRCGNCLREYFATKARLLNS